MNQATASGLAVSTGGNPVAGTFNWNSDPPNSNSWGPGNDPDLHAHHAAGGEHHLHRDLGRASGRYGRQRR